MYNNKILNTFALLVIAISCIFSFLYLFINQNNIVDGYRFIIIFPIIYFICYYFFIHKIITRYGISIFLGVFITVSFFRYIVLSVLVVETQWFYGRSYNTPSQDSFETAILIMIYELIIYSICIYIFHKKLLPLQNYKNLQVKFPNQSIIYIVFLFIVLSFTLLRPNALNFFSFFSINENIISISNVDFLTSAVSILLSIAKLLLIFMLVSLSYKIFEKRAPLISFVLISFFITINIFIYFGANRSDFIFNAIASIILLIFIYKRLGIIFSSVLTLITPIVIASITSHRQSVTITGGGNRLVDFTDLLQIYLAGIYNVAIGVEITKNNEILNPLTAIIDILRSAIGPNIILSNFDILRSSVIFNERIFSSGLVSQIIPMISQGQFYFGFIFSPLIGIFFIFIAVYFTKILIESRRIELIFLFTLFSGRLGFVMAQNGNIFINELTFFLPLFLIVYYFNNKVTDGEKLW